MNENSNSENDQPRMTNRLMKIDQSGKENTENWESNPRTSEMNQN